MTDSLEVEDWVRAYVESRNRAAVMLTGVRRRGERDRACLKVLVNAAASLTTLAPEAIGAPSGDYAILLADVAGAAWASREVLAGREVQLDMSPDPRFVAWLRQRSSAWGGQLARGLMAASDGELKALLGEAPELQTAEQTPGPADADRFGQFADRVEHAAAFLAELTATARARPAAVHQARASALDEQIARTNPDPGARISAHAFAVHELTGVYGSGGRAVRQTMLRFVATHPPDERATLQASKTAALLSDALGARARMALLDHILMLLGPHDGDSTVRTGLARDPALVLLQLEAADVEQESAEEVPASHRGARSNAGHLGTDALAEIAAEAERAIVAAGAERRTRYERAVAGNSLADPIAIVHDAVTADDHEQAWLLLQDIARRNPDADPADLVTVAPTVLGGVSLDSDGDFEGPGAGSFTILSPAPDRAGMAIASVAPRLLNVDDDGIEHPNRDAANASGTYTPNFLHELRWCDRAVQVTLDTKGAMSARMARTMVAILTDALVAEGVPALIAGWSPALDEAMRRWDGGA